MKTKLNIADCQTRDWYCLGQFFADRPFYFDNPAGNDPTAMNYGVSLGIQHLALIDYASRFVLNAAPIEKTPGYLTATEVLEFLELSVAKHGRVWPKIGLMISPSVWRASDDLRDDPEIGQRIAHLHALDIHLPKMPQVEADAIESALVKMGLKVEWEYHD